MATSIETLRAVLHPVRRRIVDYLHLHGPSQVGTLARELSQQVGSVSHHLRMLERVGVVSRARDLETDGRTSWWRLERVGLSWSVDDFDAPAERVQAKAAEKLNLDYQFGKLMEWKRVRERAPQAWRDAAASYDFSALASPAEVEELWRRVSTAMTEWREWCEARADDGSRAPVFGYVHVFPSRP